MSYVILASNSYHKVQCFGTPTGHTFKTEAAADRMARKLAKEHPWIDWLVLPVCDHSTLQAVTPIP